MDSEENSKSNSWKHYGSSNLKLNQTKIPDLSILWANVRFTSELKFSKGQQNLAPHLLKD